MMHFGANENICLWYFVDDNDGVTYKPMWEGIGQLGPVDEDRVDRCKTGVFYHKNRQYMFRIKAIL